MYGDQFAKDYIQMSSGITRWQEPFEKYGVQVAILKANSVLGLQLAESPQWQQVYQDDFATVFRRKS
jgi:hypothetical protein